MLIKRRLGWEGSPQRHHLIAGLVAFFSSDLQRSDTGEYASQTGWRIMAAGSELHPYMALTATGRSGFVGRFYHYAHLGSDIRTRLVQACADRADQGLKSMYLAPSREVIFAVREQLETLRGGIMHIQVGGLEDLEKCLLPATAVCRLDERTAVRMIQYILRNMSTTQAYQLFVSAADQEGLARLLYRQIKRIKRANVDAGQLAEKISTGPLSKEKEPLWMLLADVYTEYQTLLREKNLLDVDDLSMLAARTPELNRALLPDFLVLEGYMNVDPVHRDMLTHLLAACPDLECAAGVPFYTEAADAFLQQEIIRDLERLGFERMQEEAANAGAVLAGGDLAGMLFSPDAAGIEGGKVHFLDAPSLTDEVRQVLHRVRDLLIQGVPPTQIGLVVRDVNHYQKSLVAIAEELAIPLGMTVMEPLSNSNIIKDIVRVLARCSRVRGSEQTVEPVLLNRTPEGAHALGWLEAGWPMTGSQAEYWQQLGNWLDKADLCRLLISLHGTGDIRTQWLHAEMAALQALEQVRAEMAYTTALLPDSTQLDAEDFYLLLVREIAERSVSGIRPIGGVRVMDPDLLRGIALDHVFFMGLNDGIYPRTGEQDLFAIAHLPRVNDLPALSTAWELEREKIRFASVCAAAIASLTLSYRTANEDGSFLLPSSFLQDAAKLVDYELKPRRSMRDRFAVTPQEIMSVQELLHSWAIAGAKEDRQADLLFAPLLRDDPLLAERLNRIRHGTQIEEQRLSSAPADHYDGDLQGMSFPQQTKKYSFSASQLNTYQECPFRYFASRILGLGRQEEEDEITPMYLGNLYHKILTDYYRREPAELTLNAVTFEHCLQEALTDLEQFRYPPLFVRAKVQEIRNHLTTFLINDLTIRQEFCNSTGNELRPVFLEWNVVDDETISGVRLKATIDRVDLEYSGNEATGRFVVYDYKRKKIKNLRDILKGEDLQLPLYALLGQQAVPRALDLPAGECMGALFYSITKLERKGLYRDDWKKALGFRGRGIHAGQWPGLMAGFSLRIQTMVKHIRGGDFVLPRHCPLQGPFAAYRCDYTDMCRYQPERLAGKGGVRSHA